MSKTIISIDEQKILLARNLKVSFSIPDSFKRTWIDFLKALNSDKVQNQLGSKEYISKPGELRSLVLRGLIVKFLIKQQETSNAGN